MPVIEFYDYPKGLSKLSRSGTHALLQTPEGLFKYDKKSHSGRLIVTLKVKHS